MSGKKIFNMSKSLKIKGVVNYNVQKVKMKLVLKCENLWELVALTHNGTMQ